MIQNIMYDQMEKKNFSKIQQVAGHCVLFLFLQYIIYTIDCFMFQVGLNDNNIKNYTSHYTTPDNKVFFESFMIYTLFSFLPIVLTNTIFEDETSNFIKAIFKDHDHQDNIFIGSIFISMFTYIFGSCLYQKLQHKLKSHMYEFGKIKPYHNIFLELTNP